MTTIVEMGHLLVTNSYMTFRTSPRTRAHCVQCVPPCINTFQGKRAISARVEKAYLMAQALSTLVLVTIRVCRALAQMIRMQGCQFSY